MQHQQFWVQLYLCVEMGPQSILGLGRWAKDLAFWDLHSSQHLMACGILQGAGVSCLHQEGVVLGKLRTPPNIPGPRLPCGLGLTYPNTHFAAGQTRGAVRGIYTPWECEIPHSSPSLRLGNNQFQTLEYSTAFSGWHTVSAQSLRLVQFTIFCDNWSGTASMQGHRLVRFTSFSDSWSVAASPFTAFTNFCRSANVTSFCSQGTGRATAASDSRPSS